MSNNIDETKIIWDNAKQESVSKDINTPIDSGSADTIDESQVSWDTPTFTEASFPSDKETTIKEISNPIEGIGMSLAKGYAESLAGANVKLLGVAALANSPNFDTRNLQATFKQNAEYWGEVTKQAEDMGGNNALWNIVGGLPIGAAEFGTAANPVSIVALATVSSALKDYGDAVMKNPDAKIDFGNFGAGVVGGALTAGTLGAIHYTGAGLENAAKLIEKHGEDTIAKLFTAINNGDAAKGEMALKILKDKLYNKKEILKTPEQLSAEQQATKEAYTAQTKEEVFKMREAHTREVQDRNRTDDFNLDQRKRELKAESDLKISKAQDAVSDLESTQRESLRKLRDVSDINISRRSEAGSVALQETRESGKEAIGRTAGELAERTSAAKMAVQEDLQATFTAMGDAIKCLKDVEGKVVNTQWGRLIDEHPGVGVDSHNILPNILKADGGEKIFRFSVKDGEVIVSAVHPSMNQQAAHIQREINNSLTTIDGTSTVTANIMKISHDLFSQMAHMPADKGALAPGVGKVFGNLADAFHVKNYADNFSGDARLLVDDILSANERYGGYKDKLSEVYSNYFKANGEPNIEMIFNRMDRGDKLFMDKLARVEEVQGIRAEDKVFEKIRQSHALYQRVAKAEKEQVTKLEEALKKTMREDNAAFNKSIDALRKGKIRAVENKTLSNRERLALKREEVGTLTRQESQRISDELSALHAANVKESQAMLAAFREKIHQFGVSRAETLRTMKSEMAEQTLINETKHMLRSFRPASGMAHILQNIGLYGAAGAGMGMMTGTMKATTAIPLAIGKGLMSVALAPRSLAEMSRFALRHKPAIKAGVRRTKKTGEFMQSTLLKRLLATQTSQ